MLNALNENIYSSTLKYDWTGEKVQARDHEAEVSQELVACGCLPIFAEFVCEFVCLVPRGLNGAAAKSLQASYGKMEQDGPPEAGPAPGGLKGVMRGFASLVVAFKELPTPGN